MNALVTIASLIFATIAAAAEVTVENISFSGDRAKKTPVELHLFGGQGVELEFAVEASLGAKVSLTASLFQLARGLAAPLQAGLALGGPVDFSKQTRRLIRATLPLPEVKQKTEVLLRIQAQLETEARPQPVGDARLFVYPQKLASELASFIAELDHTNGGRVAVFGESARIRAFFKAHEIIFSDCGLELPRELNARDAYLGEAQAEAVTRNLDTAPPGARVIFFSVAPGAIPGVYVSTFHGVLLTKVTLPILDSLTTNPQSQQAFADLLHQTLSTNSP